MSLINCYECETPVSEHADRCALCRAPIEAEPIRPRPLLASVSWPLVALVIAVTCILAGCGDSATGFDGETVPPGTYDVSFSVAPSLSIPGALVGDHSFTFRIGEPGDETTNDAGSTIRFRLLDSEKGGDVYLSDDPGQVIGGGRQWRVWLQYEEFSSLGVGVTLVAEANSRGFRLPFGCWALEFDAFPPTHYDGLNCTVTRR